MEEELREQYNNTELYKKFVLGEFAPAVEDALINLKDIAYTPTNHISKKYIVVSNPTPPDSGFIKHFFEGDNK